jgi:hypothetical protein
MKVKALKENVLKYGEKKGAVLEVSEETGKHLIKNGFAEEVKANKQNKNKSDKEDK